MGLVGALGAFNQQPIRASLPVWLLGPVAARGAWANRDDTTETGAYCLALANVEATRGLVAVRRAQGRTGVDYYLGPADSALEDLEASVRLEVSSAPE